MWNLFFWCEMMMVCIVSRSDARGKFTPIVVYEMAFSAVVFKEAVEDSYKMDKS